MELTQASDVSPKDTRGHSLRGDVARAYLGLLLGVLVALILEPILRPNYVPVLVALYSAPVAFIVILTNYHSASTSLSIARSVGGSAGWLGFPALAGGTFSPVYQFGGSITVLIVFPLLAAGLVTFGMIVGDRLWFRYQVSRWN